MPTEQAVPWNIQVSKQTDLSLRFFLGSQGMKQTDLSTFVEQAVFAHVLHSTIEDIYARNRNADPDEIEAETQAVIQEVRSEARDRAQDRQA